MVMDCKKGVTDIQNRKLGLERRAEVFAKRNGMCVLYKIISGLQ